MNHVYGGVAQLGERTVRIRKVKGSNPSVSTTKVREINYFTDFLLFFGGIIALAQCKYFRVNV